MDIIPTLNYRKVAQMQAIATEYQEKLTEIHIDFADGVFVENTLPDVAQVSQIQTTMRIEAHLMVQEPASWVTKALEDPRIDVIIIHAEAAGDLKAVLQQIRQANRRPGLALKPETPLEAMQEYLGLVDQLLLMTVNPGFNGAPFIPEVLEKVKAARQAYPSMIIECDGGVSPQTIASIAAAGCYRVAVGSYFHRQSLDEGLRQLRLSLDNPPAAN